MNDISQKKNSNCPLVVPPKPYITIIRSIIGFREIPRSHAYLQPLKFVEFVALGLCVILCVPSTGIRTLTNVDYSKVRVCFVLFDFQFLGAALCA